MPYIKECMEDPDVFTTEISMRIAEHIGCAVISSSSDLNLLGDSYSFMRNEISRLQQQKIIKKRAIHH